MIRRAVAQPKKGPFTLPNTGFLICYQSGSSKLVFVLQRVRVEPAEKALETNTDDITSLMYNAGYNDPKTFRSVFRQITGLTPQGHRKKYSCDGVGLPSATAWPV